MISQDGRPDNVVELRPKRPEPPIVREEDVVLPKQRDPLWDRLRFAAAVLVVVPVFALVAAPIIAWKEVFGDE